MISIGRLVQAMQQGAGSGLQKLIARHALMIGFNQC